MRIAASALALLLAAASPSLAQQPEGAWSNGAERMSSPRSELQAVTVAGKIYVMGGDVVGFRDGEQVTLPDTGIAQLYDPATDEWRDLPPAPSGANHNGIAELNGKIYIAGGFAARQHGAATDRFFVFDTKSEKWQELPRLSSPRGAPALIALGGKIHIIGGRKGPAAIADHEVFDPATAKWSKLAPLPVARDHVGVAVVDGKIHIYGGRRTDANSNVGLHDVYDPAADRWTSAAPMPVPVSSGTFAQYRGLLLYLGGECRGERTFSEVQAYDPKTDKWRLLAPMPRERHANAAAVAGQKLYMFGGATGCGAKGLVDDALVFTLP